MVLSSANCGKYLMPKWHRMRVKAMIDRTQFTAEELVWLEVTADQGTGALNPENFKALTTPIDPLTESKDRDIREDHDKA
jgi:hypothetical protein